MTDDKSPRARKSGAAARNLQFEAAAEYVAELGEGSIWDAEAQVLYWVDITAKRVFAFDPDTGLNRRYEMPEQVGTVVPTDRGTLLAAMESQIAELNLENGAVVKLLEIEPDLQHNRCNDGKCDPAGRLWVGTMSMKKQPNAGALYRIGPDLKPVEMISGVTTSNGIVWSTDCSRMYYIDTGTRCVDEFTYDLDSGGIAGRRTVIQVDDSLGAPDGMTIDAEGMLWVALFHGAAVIRIDPRSGELLRRYAIPAKNVTSVAFGGAALETLFVTTASIAMDADERDRYPLAGKLFGCRPGVRGAPSFRFRFE